MGDKDDAIDALDRIREVLGCMKPSVLIELDKPRNIRLDTNAIALVEEVLDKPIDEFGTRFGVREIRAVLWAGLLHEDKSLTLEDVGNLIDLVDPKYVGAQVGKAMRLSFNMGDPEAGGEGKN